MLNALRQSEVCTHNMYMPILLHYFSAQRLTAIRGLYTYISADVWDNTKRAQRLTAIRGLYTEQSDRVDNLPLVLNALRQSEVCTLINSKFKISVNSVLNALRQSEVCTLY